LREGGEGKRGEGAGGDGMGREGRQEMMRRKEEKESRGRGGKPRDKKRTDFDREKELRRATSEARYGARPCPFLHVPPLPSYATPRRPSHPSDKSARQRSGHGGHGAGDDSAAQDASARRVELPHRLVIGQSGVIAPSADCHAACHVHHGLETAPGAWREGEGKRREAPSAQITNVLVIIF
jgi:hypothetical protein